MLASVSPKARRYWAIVNLALILIGLRFKLIGALAMISFGLQFYADMKPERRAKVDVAIARYLPKRDATANSVTGVWLGLGAIGAALFVTGHSVGRLFERSESSASSVALSGLFWLVVFVEVAFVEELVCRGFLYDYIGERRGAFAAIAGSSVAFAAMHSLNPHTTLRAVVFLVPAGVMFAAARFATGSLWLGIGMHLGWNFAEGWLFGTPVSGLHVEPLFRFRAAANPLWSGGSFGPEAGLGVVVVVSAIALVLVLVGVGRNQGPREIRVGVLDGEA